ncbi:carbohydrate sulfotransferase 1-like [Saccoglossus kowalevskii]|uniref:Carbohydrate sulfotransferase 1-like n=1 Tax=Saccoglossus kowalevskii TaxID=10224 RepID=A0ABM0GIY3_SACKO|nr:PREDICTED: carbohydrate sulfotransferase 1-like [Saccoglossus kowalevskii]
MGCGMRPKHPQPNPKAPFPDPGTTNFRLATRVKGDPWAFSPAQSEAELLERIVHAQDPETSEAEHTSLLDQATLDLRPPRTMKKLHLTFLGFSTFLVVLYIAVHRNYGNHSMSMSELISNYDLQQREDPDPGTLADKSVHVLVNGRMRTGSSLIGRYFSHHPDFMYLYEPEQSLRLPFDRLNDSAEHVEKLQLPFYDLLECFFECNFTRSPDLIRFIRRVKWMAFLSEFEHASAKGMTFEILTKMCRAKRHKVVKTVRVNDITNGLRTLKKYDVKVIQIVRDPRGMINSKGLRNRTDVITRVYCDWLKTNMDAATKGPDWFRSNYFIVRYEDLSERPREVVPQLYNFIGIPLNDNISGILLSSQKALPGNSVKWRYTLPFNTTQIVQDNCPNDVFERLGYIQIYEEEVQHDESVQLVLRMPLIDGLNSFNG